MKTPTLVVVGDQTYKDFAMLGSEHAKCLGNATLETLIGVSHNGPLKEPETFATMIEDFLRVH